MSKKISDLSRSELREAVTRLSLENEILREQGVGATIRGVALSIIRNGVLLGIVIFAGYYGERIAKAWAGRTTIADIELGVSADVGGLPGWVIAAIVSCVITTAYAIGYGFHERRLRKQAVYDLGRYRTMVERHIDPDRSSSGLNYAGDHPREENEEC